MSELTNISISCSVEFKRRVRIEALLKDISLSKYIITAVDKYLEEDDLSEDESKDLTTGNSKMQEFLDEWNKQHEDSGVE